MYIIFGQHDVESKCIGSCILLKVLVITYESESTSDWLIILINLSLIPIKATCSEPRSRPHNQNGK